MSEPEDKAPEQVVDAEPNAADTGSTPQSSVEAPPESRWPERVLLGLLALAAAGFVAFRLGASLLGQRVFLGLDLLNSYAPWSAQTPGGPTESSRFVQDQIDFFIPGLHEVASRLINGDLAAWSPYVGGGSSLLGTPVFGLISSSRWVYLVLPTWLAPGFAKLAELVLAALFTYLLVRRLNGSKLAAGLAGFIYPTTGFMIAWTNWPQTGVAALIPMLFWAVERFVQEGRARAAIPVGIASALLLFGGFPAVAGLSFYAAGGYALVRILTKHRSSIGAAARTLGVLAGAVLAGAGLAAVQLIPFVYQFLETVDLTYREQSFFREEPLRYLLSMVFPMSHAGNFLDTYDGPFNPVEVNTYIGSVVMLLVAIGVLDLVRRRNNRSAAVYLAALGLVAVGLIWFQGPWSAWLNNLPIFANNPIGRIRAQLGVPVAVLAAFGFDRLLAGMRERRDATRTGWSWPIAGLSVVFAVGICLAAVRVGSGDQPGLSADVLIDAVVAAAPVALFALLVLVAVKVARLRVVAMAVAIVGIVTQAVAATEYYWPTGERADFYRVTAAHEYLQDNLGTDRIVTAGSPLLPNATSIADLRILTGHAFFPARMKELLLAISPGAFPAPTYSAFDADISAVISSPGLDRMGVRYLVAGPGAEILGEVDGTTGLTDAMTKDLQPETDYQATIDYGQLRGIHIPLWSVDRRAMITVTVSTPAGEVLATNSHRVNKGDQEVIVPIALEPTPAGGDLRVEVSVDVDGVIGLDDGTGNLRVNAFRPPAEPDGVRIAYAADGLVIWERLSALPRIRWSGEVEVVSGNAPQLQRVVSEPAESTSVVLSAEPPAGYLNSPDVAKLQVLEDSGDTTRITVTAPAAGYVVVADNIQDDFAATVDGVEAPIVDADYAVGAVYVSAGTHQVEITYAPRGRQLGAAITALSAAALVGFAVPPSIWARLRPRRRRGSDDAG